ncbi:MAG: putative zeaxanthin b-glucosyltransferase, Glycosyltransferase Family 1 [Polaromonas sp.]|nr:putative zeaxanthin b-glucosyltransferase, Glycosyltransferase Family 1 [Polaromonas sp.]
MTHFTVIAPPFTSHVRALEALAGGLIARGHRVSWIHQADVGQLLQDSRIEFRPAGLASHPAGSLAQTVARAASPGGPLGLGRVIADVAASTDMLCREGPALLRALGSEALIADQMEAAGGLLAEGLGLPFISVACALPVNRDPRVPLPVMPWGYAAGRRGEQLNEGSARVYDWMMQPHARVIARHARAFGLPPKATLADCLSPLAQISQATRSFDFPRSPPPAHFHPVGPLRPPLAREPALDLPVDSRRPFVFASLGTLQGGRVKLFRRIAQACRALDAQLLLAHCDQLDAGQAEALLQAGATWVAGFAPQRAALARADAAVSHAGLNTVLDALAANTPVLALPIAFDQPGVAARLAHCGAGLRLQPALASAAAIQKALRRLLEEPVFGQRAALLGADVRQSGGVGRAVEIIEAALSAPKRPRPAPADETALSGGWRRADAFAMADNQAGIKPLAATGQGLAALGLALAQIFSAPFSSFPRWGKAGMEAFPNPPHPGAKQRPDLPEKAESWHSSTAGPHPGPPPAGEGARAAWLETMCADRSTSAGMPALPPRPAAARGNP